MIDLKPEHREIVLEILRRRAPDCEVWIFGSRVKGKAKPHSDLDIALMAAAPLGNPLIWEIEEDFSESDLPFRVDVLDWASVNESFREVIRRDHAVLAPAGKAA